MRAAARRRADGFTLIEVLAVLFLTALVFGVALNFYVDLSDQSLHASEATRDVRRAASLLDRLARDFEAAVLERKPEEVDPLAHPWIFFADARRGSGGADRARFVARRTPDRRGGDAAGDLAVVSYALRESESGDAHELLRWSQPYVPADFDFELPPLDDPAALRLADGITHFALRFQDEAGEWTEDWDSSQLVESGALPLAVEIELALAPFDPDADPGDTAPSYRRRVLLPVRPLDFATLLDPEAYAASGGEQGEQDCALKVSDCVDLGPLASAGNAPEAGPPGLGKSDGPPRGLQGLLSLTKEQREGLRAIQEAGGLGGMCWSDWKGQYGDRPVLRPECR